MRESLIEDVLNTESKVVSNYQICTRCIMDTTVSDIEFDEQGVCNYCRLYDSRVQRELYHHEAGQQRIEIIIAQIKQKMARRDYDCIIGVSGGADSTFVAYLVRKRFGLRPLAIHLDNGWNSEIAVHNIELTLKHLDIDLYTHVLDWEEFKDIQLAFLRASIPNAEIPTDHAIVATLFHTAASMNIPYIITGSNIVTEAVMPGSWMADATDARLIKSVHRQFGHLKLKTYPRITVYHFAYYTLVKGIKFFPILNYVPYVKTEVKQLLYDELGWRDYGGKHYESIFTRFFQSYILPKKYNIDKRKAHFSNLILSGQMTREEALAEIKFPPYPLDKLEEEAIYVMKKLDLDLEEFKLIMDAPSKTVLDYPNNTYLWSKFASIVKFGRRKAIIGA